MQKSDLVGEVFGRLTVLSRAAKSPVLKSKGYRYLCKCVCGNKKIVSGSSLKVGDTKSCGCLQKEKVAKTATKHGLYQSDMYIVWKNMISRCYNPKNISYPNYGGRGIKVCKRWRGLSGIKNFHKDMHPRPIPKKYRDVQIDRINNENNYYPENCRWVTPKQNSRNKRDNVIHTYNGITQTIAEWAEYAGISNTTLWRRLKSGWSIKKSIETPLNEQINLFTFKGKTKNISEWAKEYNMQYSTLEKRLHIHKWPIKKALTTPIEKTIKLCGVKQTVMQWSKDFNIPYEVLWSRINKSKWSLFKSLIIPYSPRFE